jgi:hypothetical protein
MADPNHPDDPNPSGNEAERAKRARAALLSAIEDQLRSGDPPETRETLARLLAEGHSKEEALRLIASALVAEVSAVLRGDSSYDRARYVARLNDLPRLPWEKDGEKAGD